MFGRKKYRKNREYFLIMAVMDLRNNTRLYTRREVVWFNENASELQAFDVMLDSLIKHTEDESLTPQDAMVVFYSLVRN